MQEDEREEFKCHDPLGLPGLGLTMKSVIPAGVVATGGNAVE